MAETIGGGGEWTALREALLAKAKEWRRRERHAGSPGEACVYPFLADELEALAAAAPAQDGQGAELLGPPRGGSSSDLADSDSPSVGCYVASRASIPARSEMWRSLRSQGFAITSTWIDEAGEGETGDFRELWERIWSEIHRSSHLVLYADPQDFPLKGALVEVGIALGMGKRVVVVAPAVKLEGRTCRPLGSWIKHPNVSFQETLEAAIAAPSLPEAVAGNASAPVGEKRQPSGVGEPPAKFLPITDVTFGSPTLYHTGNSIAGDPIYSDVPPTPSPTEGASSPADARTELVQKEVGEGLREVLDTEVMALLKRVDEDARGTRCLTMAEVTLCLKALKRFAALAAPAPKLELTSRDCICPTTCDGPEYNLKILPNCPWHSRAPKPAPPAEPPFQDICVVEPANGIVNHYIAVICYLPDDKFKNGDQVRVTVEPVRRAAERKPPR